MCALRPLSGTTRSTLLHDYTLCDARVTCPHFFLRTLPLPSSTCLQRPRLGDCIRPGITCLPPRRTILYMALCILPARGLYNSSGTPMPNVHARTWTHSGTRLRLTRRTHACTFINTYAARCCSPSPSVTSKSHQHHRPSSPFWPPSFSFLPSTPAPCPCRALNYSGISFSRTRYVTQRLPF